jgi:hypothetical protein
VLVRVEHGVHPAHVEALRLLAEFVLGVDHARAALEI